MAGGIQIREMLESDRTAVMRIFNYYATTSFAAYPDGPLPSSFFSLLWEGALCSIVLDDAGRVAGFGLLKPFLPFPAFKKNGMLTYFITPEDTGRGYGTRVLGWLTDNAQNAGIRVLVANMSSRNEASIRFHKRHGFSEAGNLAGVGEKFGEPFDLLLMQRVVD